MNFSARNIPCQLTVHIPKDFASIQMYRGSLGHKINHSFEPNAVFTFQEVARFGISVVIKTLRGIQKDEEIFVNYGYHKVHSPKWHQDLFLQYAQENPSLVNQADVDQVKDYQRNIDHYKRLYREFQKLDPQGDLNFDQFKEQNE